MADTIITRRVSALGHSAAIYLPAWLCRELSIAVGREYTLRASRGTLRVVFAPEKKLPRGKEKA